jgi:excisionase family DNA binding protein
MPDFSRASKEARLEGLEGKRQCLLPSNLILWNALAFLELYAINIFGGDFKMLEKTEKKFYVTSEVTSLLRVSLSWLCGKIRKGEIKAVKVGRKYLIPAEEVKRLLGEEESEEEKVK